MRVSVTPFVEPEDPWDDDSDPLFWEYEEVQDDEEEE